MEILGQRRVLITGGAGFIGTHLAERLCDNNMVIIFDNLRRDSLSETQLRSHPNVEVIEGDVLDLGRVKSVLDGVDTVIHLAAIAGVSSYYAEPVKTLRVNIIGTANVIESAVQVGVRTFVYLSSSEIFGPNALDTDEESACCLGPVSDRRWVYGTSKLAGEHLILRHGEEYGIDCSVLRPFNVYGPRQTGEGAIANFCAAAVQGKPLMVYGDGSAIRAWCYITDMVDAVVKVLCLPGSVGHVFNIGNPNESLTTIELARRISGLVGGVEIQLVPTQRAEVHARIPTIEKARRTLGYEPKMGLDEGLKLTLAWFQSRR